MRAFFILLLLTNGLVRATPADGCCVISSRSALTFTARPTIARCELAVDGMTCSACEKAVRNALIRESEVRSVDVDWRAGRAAVVFDAHVGSAARLVKALAGAGYKARVIRVSSKETTENRAKATTHSGG